MNYTRRIQLKEGIGAHNAPRKDVRMRRKRYTLDGEVSCVEKWCRKRTRKGLHWNPAPRSKVEKAAGTVGKHPKKRGCTHLSSAAPWFYTGGGGGGGGGGGTV